MSFPLMKLPLLAKEHVIGQMNVMEQYEIAGLNKKLKNSIQFVSRKQNFELFITCTNSMKITIINNHQETEFTYSISSSSSIQFLEVLKKNLIFVKETFHLSSVKLKFFDDKCPNLIHYVIVMFRELNIEVDTVMAYSFVDNDLIYVSLLHHCSNVPNFKLIFEKSDQFQITARNFPIFKNKSLCISESDWVNADLLMNNFMDCNELILSRNKVTTQELNMFLKKWIEGSSLDDVTISRINASMYDNLPEMETAMLGIPSTLILLAKVHDQVKEFLWGTCFEITQLSGNKALVYYLRNDFCLTTKFSLEFDGTENFFLPRMYDGNQMYIGAVVENIDGDY